MRDVIIKLRDRYPEGKFIVYSTRVARVKAVAQVLECEAYFRDIEDKKNVFDRIVQPECPVVVATNALGLGIDMSNIRAVIHVDRPRSMRDFGQESSCAGRDGQVSDLVVIVPLGFEYSDARVAVFVRGQTCCWVILDKYLNSREDRAGCEAHKQTCYVC